MGYSINSALLAKQSWRIISNPTSLLATILKAKYHRSSSYLDANVGARPSFVWSSLIKGRNLLNKGLFWTIGDGEDINIWNDHWIPKEPFFKPITKPDFSNSHLQTVNQLISNDNWHLPTLKAHFLEPDFHSITRIHIPPNPRPNKVIWFYSKKGEYTVKTGYQLALREYMEKDSSGDTSNPTRTHKIWDFIWASPAIPRVRSFLWRLASNSLSLGINLKRRRISDGLCQICNTKVETWQHCLFDCKWVKKLWRTLPAIKIPRETTSGSFLDFCSTLMDTNRDVLSLLYAAFWCIWKTRNAAIFEGRAIYISKVADQAVVLQAEFSHLNVVNQCSLDIFFSPSRWINPTGSTLTLYVDVCYRNGFGAAGMILRDKNGSIVSSASCYLGPLASVEMGELMAMEFGLKETERIYNGDLVVYSDALNCVIRVNDNEPDISILGNKALDVRLSGPRFNSIKFSHVKRMGNLPAHILANLGFDLLESNALFCNWGSEPPTTVLLAVIADLNEI